MSRIFNLSYDISADLAKQNHVKEEDLLTRESFLNLLIDSSVINTSAKLSIRNIAGFSYSHIVINPVETTIIFKSNLERKEIVKILHSYIKQLYYVITEVKEDENEYLGTLHCDDELQTSCDEIVKSILANQ